jgi:hypothetical protein
MLRAGSRSEEPGGASASSEDKPMTNKPIVLAAALVVTAGLVGFKMLVYPPVTLAAPSQSVDIHQIALSTPKDLPSFDANYQRHIGVLDVLNK